MFGKNVEFEKVFMFDCNLIFFGLWKGFVFLNSRGLVRKLFVKLIRYRVIFLLIEFGFIIMVILIDEKYY